MSLGAALFYLGAGLMLFTALRTVTARRLFHSALYLAATLALVAVQYLLLRAEFLAVVQLLVYVGAVIILIIFAVMLTAKIGDDSVGQTNRYALPALAGCGALFWLLFRALSAAEWKGAAGAPPGGGLGGLQAIGKALLADYVFPFEAVGLLLLTALVGAVLIARKDPE